MMKKGFLAAILAVFMLGGCSYVSWMNPWGQEKKEPVEKVWTINEFLWKASVDRLSFAQIEKENPEKGLIETGWFTMEGYEREMFKIKVEILTRDLRSDGLKVSVEKKEQRNGKWFDEEAGDRLQSSIQHRILLKARDLYRQSLMRK